MKLDSITDFPVFKIFFLSALNPLQRARSKTQTKLSKDEDDEFDGKGKECGSMENASHNCGPGSANSNFL